MATVNYTTRVEDGTKTAPGYSFRQDTDTGVYRIGANNIGISAGDTKVLDATATLITASVALKAASGLFLPASVSYTAGDTTPTVSGVSSLSIANATPTTITNFDDGTEGQIIILRFQDGNTTINRDNAYLAGGTNFTSSANDVMVLIKAGAIWWEVCRSVNA